MTTKERINAIVAKARKKVTTAYIAKVALLSAISFILYMYAKFSLPFMFPGFLDMQFSELPAILAGFSLGPVAGGLVIIIKCLIKFPFSGTAFVGEITDIILGLVYVLPASIVYQKIKTKKGAVIGLFVGTVATSIIAIILNRFVSVPFYVQFYFHGNFNVIVGMCQGLYPGMTAKTFYYYYLFVAVLPFNLLRLGIVSVVTFLVYKKLSKALHWEFKPKKGKNNKEESTEIQKVGETEEMNILPEVQENANIEE